MQYPLGPLQLVEVEVDGGSMWVMKETDGPSSDPPQAVHLRKRALAQLSTTSTLERSAKSPRKTGMQRNLCG